MIIIGSCYVMIISGSCYVMIISGICYVDDHQWYLLC